MFRVRDLVFIFFISFLLFSTLALLDRSRSLERSCEELEEKYEVCQKEKEELNEGYKEKSTYLEEYKEKYTKAEAEKLRLEWELEKRGVELEEYSLSLDDILLIAEISRLEAGDKEEGQKAVTKVIENRLESDRFPNSVKEVIYQPGQFSTARLVKGNVDEKCLLNVLEVIIEGYDMPSEVLFFHADTGVRTNKFYALIDGNVFTF